MKDLKEIVLTTINAKWIHPSLALRLLKANLGELEERCEIIEFALRQPLQEKIDALSAVSPKILGISVSIWNHTATIEVLKELKNKWKNKQTIDKYEEEDSARKLNNLLPAACYLLPIIVLGGPEVSHLPQDAEIFKYVDFVVRGEGEIAFRELCEKIIAGKNPKEKFIEAGNVDVSKIKTAYHLYTDEDAARKLIYVESSRDCPFGCEFCLSSLKEDSLAGTQRRKARREFYLKDFFSEMDVLINQGAKTFKFLDRAFNANIKRAIQICEYFLEKLKERAFTAHFEMVPVLFTPELLETLARFPPPDAGAGRAENLRLEIGIQSLNSEVAERINLPGRNGKTAAQILEPLRFLCEKTNAIIHADLIAGLPGEDLASFGRGFDLLWDALSGAKERAEIQLGILKLLPGAPIARFSKEFKMRFNSEPPYEILETSVMCAEDAARLKNFARFWELLVNRGLFTPDTNGDESIFNKFMPLSDGLFAHFGRNWGIDKEELRSVALEKWQKMPYI